MNAETHRIRLERVYHVSDLIGDVSAEEHSVISPLTIKHYHLIIKSFAAVIVLIFELEGNTEGTRHGCMMKLYCAASSYTFFYFIAPKKHSPNDLKLI